ncbi:MAG TPA: hypothetical protein VF760_12130, partial [Xanthobacteraceae bacterium]
MQKDNRDYSDLILTKGLFCGCEQPADRRNNGRNCREYGNPVRLTFWPAPSRQNGRDVAAKPIKPVPA